MKRVQAGIVVFWLLSSAMSSAQEANYDETKVPKYSLPNPLVMNDGTRVKSAEQWTNQRRSEVLTLFMKHAYGAMPPAKKITAVVEHETVERALAGKATLRQMTLYFTEDKSGPNFDICIFLPTEVGGNKPVPAILGCNFFGNHTVSKDPNLRMSNAWVHTKHDRGARASRWAIEKIVGRGYALVTLCYGDIDPDFDDKFKNGVHSLFPEFQERDDNWATIGAWAWGLSRVLDYLETVDEIDATRVAVMGHSRLGKTALWAGATDERFALVVSNNSGCGGAALSRRRYGETVKRINTVFPHWFCKRHRAYNGKEDSLPVDQHLLIALVAPRPVYVGSAVDDLWADPRGEFLSCVAADPVYRLLGTKGLPEHQWPPVDKPVMGRIGYHVRAGKHNVTDFDWKCYLDFADKHFKN